MIPALTGGWQTGDPSAILKKYGTKKPGLAGGFPVLGAQGDVGDPGELDQPEVPSYDTATGSDSTMVGDVPTTPQVQGMMVRPPSQNSMQAHQAEAQDPGMREISPQRRYFWGTGLIDARARQAPSNARTDFDATFGSGAQHMGTPGTTWEQRQAQNQQKISSAKTQRGLDDWAPY